MKLPEAGAADSGPDAEEKVQVPPHVNCVKDDSGQVVLLNMETGYIHTLNKSAALAWDRLIDAGLDSASALLADTYGIDRDKARQDLVVLIGELRARGLVESAADSDMPPELDKAG